MSNDLNQNKTDIDLISFLRSHRLHKEDKHKIKPTHTALPGNYKPGTYNIPDEKLEELNQLITDHIFVKNLPLHLTESHNGFDYSQYMDDIDIKIPTTIETIKRLYTTEDILSYCYYSFKILEKMFDLSDNQKVMYITEKPQPNFEEKISMAKDGWHIMIPDLVINYEKQRELRNLRMNDKNIIELFKSICPKMSINNIIDKAIIKTNNWFVYGASKPNKKAYYLSFIVKYNAENDKLDVNIVNDEYMNYMNWKNSDLVNMFSIRNKSLNFNDKIDLDV
jgi:hypothetical protein